MKCVKKESQIEPPLKVRSETLLSSSQYFDFQPSRLKKMIFLFCSRFPLKTKLRLHMDIHDPIKRLICDKCGKTFQTKYNLNKHIEKDHPTVKPEPLQCLICNTWYRNPDGLKAHNKNMHSNLDTEHRCHICQKVSTTYRALKRHINFNHVRERKFKCTMCEKAFKRSQDLRVSVLRNQCSKDNFWL